MPSLEGTCLEKRSLYGPIQNKFGENHRNLGKTPEMPLTKGFRQWMVDCGTVLKPA